MKRNELTTGVLQRRLRGAAFAAAASLALLVTGVAVAALAVFAFQPVPALIAFLLWGLAFGALPPLLQTRLLHTSSAAFRDTASALYTTSFNVGIGGGALVGALIFDAGGLMLLPWCYVGLLVLSIVLVMVVGRMTRQRDITAA